MNLCKIGIHDYEVVHVGRWKVLQELSQTSEFIGWAIRSGDYGSNRRLENLVTGESISVTDTEKVISHPKARVCLKCKKITKNYNIDKLAYRLRAELDMTRREKLAMDIAGLT